MTEMVQSRRTAEKKPEQHDLFSSLLDASEDESDGQAKLTDSELLGKNHILGDADPRLTSLYRKYLHLFARRYVVIFLLFVSAERPSSAGHEVGFTSQQYRNTG